MNSASVSRQVPSREDAELARISGQRLAPLVRAKRRLTMSVRDAGRDMVIELPAGAVELLLGILEDMAAGRAVAIVPRDAELTTQEAADILNVSRPFIVQLLREGKLPYRKVGTHRRIRLEDVTAFKAAIDQDRRRVLDELVIQAQELDMGY
jgi:excisionase family DNA binding protein